MLVSALTRSQVLRRVFAGSQRASGVRAAVLLFARQVVVELRGSATVLLFVVTEVLSVAATPMLLVELLLETAAVMSWRWCGAVSSASIAHSGRCRSGAG